MKTIALFSALALGALTSAALAATPTKTAATPATTAATQQAGRVELSDTQMDTFKAGYNRYYHYNYNNGNDYQDRYQRNSYHCNNC
jgi:phosphate-selective porin